MPHAPMVGRGRYALPAQHVGDLLGAFARTDVDDARAGDVAYQAQQLPVLVVGVADAVRKVGTCEAAPQDMRFGEPQVAHDVFGHEFRGRSRERQHRDTGQLLAQLGDAQVRRAEVVAPLRDAVGFVDGHERYVHAHDAQAEGFRREPLGGDVKELDVAVDTVVQRDVDCTRREPRMDRHGRDVPCPQAVDLVFHQGDQGRHDDAQPLLRKPGDLVGKRLSAARGHQGQGVAPVHHRTDDTLLYGAEFGEAPVAFQHVVYLVRCPFHEYKGRKN